MAGLALVSSFLLLPSSLRAQGALTPPGATAPTMKSLAQIEPRTPVATNTTPGDANSLFIISQPGSYYLTTNIVASGNVGGIEINANNVTLDLNGFALDGGAVGSYGIYDGTAQTNVTVRNGNVSGWENGVFGGNLSSSSLVFERLNLSSNFNGLYVYGQGVVRDCNFQGNAGDALVCMGGGLVTGCTVKGSASSGPGIDLAAPGIVSGCVSLNNGGIGIRVVSGIVSGCMVQGNQLSGSRIAGTNSEVVGNNCVGNNAANLTTEAGIYSDASNSRIEDNHVTGSGYAGILAASGNTNNIIIRNTVIGNGANNYVVPSGNDLGPVGAASTATSPWANISH
jgi:hypothetical protein